MYAALQECFEGITGLHGCNKDQWTLCNSTIIGNLIYELSDEGINVWERRALRFMPITLQNAVQAWDYYFIPDHKTCAFNVKKDLVRKLQAREKEVFGKGILTDLQKKHFGAQKALAGWEDESDTEMSSDRSNE